MVDLTRSGGGRLITIGPSHEKSRRQEPEREAPVADKPKNYSAEIEKVQREMLADGFPVTVDGLDGPETKRIIESYRQAKAEKQRQDAASAQATAAAKAAEAAAEAEKQRVETERVKAEAETKRLDAQRVEAERKEKEDREKRGFEEKERQEKAAQDATERNIKLGLGVAFPLAGAAAGHKVADWVNKADIASVKARAANLKALAKEARATLKERPALSGAAKTTNTRQLAAITRTADKLQLTKTKGWMAKTFAAMFIAEGAYSRFVVAPQTENPIGKEALQLTSNASIFAATSLIGTRAMQNATPTVQPVAADLAAIEKARTIATPAEKTISGSAKKQVIKRIEGKAAQKAATSLLSKGLGVVALVAGIAAVVETARAEGLSAAAKQAADVIDPTNGLLSKAIDAATGGNEPATLTELARQQAVERQANTTPLKVEPTPSSTLLRDEVYGALQPGQAALMAKVANEGLDNFYAGQRPAELERRVDSLGKAQKGALEVASRPPANPQVDAVPSPAPAGNQYDDSGNHLKGFQNPQNLLAAQLARSAKGS